MCRVVLFLFLAGMAAANRALAEQAAAALSPRKLAAALDLVGSLREALDFHLGAGHLAGWLAAGLAELG